MLLCCQHVVVSLNGSTPDFGEKNPNPIYGAVLASPPPSPPSNGMVLVIIGTRSHRCQHSGK